MLTPPPIDALLGAQKFLPCMRRKQAENVWKCVNPMILSLEITKQDLVWLIAKILYMPTPSQTIASINAPLIITVMQITKPAGVNFPAPTFMMMPLETFSIELMPMTQPRDAWRNAQTTQDSMGTTSQINASHCAWEELLGTMIRGYAMMFAFGGSMWDLTMAPSTPTQILQQTFALKDVQEILLLTIGRWHALIFVLKEPMRIIRHGSVWRSAL